VESGKKLRILLSGASGLIGKAFAELLRAKGHTVIPLVRRAPGEGEVGWDPFAGVLDSSRLEGLDAVIHLAGETISSRWTPAKKKAIRESRVRGTAMLAEVAAQTNPKPKVFICASATGFYGNRGEENLEEASAPGTGFLPEVCGEWEAAVRPAKEAGIRVVNLRTGIVLTPKGGALGQMLLPFKLGLGGVIGSGKQWMSWISLADEVGAIYHALTHSELEGPVNLTAPHPVTNREFTRVLGKVLGRPTIFPLPGFVVKALFGEMGEALLLEGQKVFPGKLLKAGFSFSHPALELALRWGLNKEN